MIETLALSFTLVLARVSTFLAVLPFLGATGVPRTVRAGLALALTVFWLAATAPAVPAAGAAAALASWPVVGLAMAREVLLGALFGFALGLITLPAHIAGEYLSQEVGLTFGNLINPTGAAAATPLTQIIESSANLIFFGLDGHHLFFAALFGSFALYPVGAGPWPGVPAEYLVGGVATAQEAGIVLALPAAACVFLTTVVLALLSRVAPQLSLYNVGFPLRLMVGLAALYLLLPGLVRGIVAALTRSSDFLIGLG